MASHTELKSISHIGDSGLSDNVELNVASFFQWGLLGVGNFFNVTLDAPGAFGGDASRLRRVTEDPSWDTGEVWEAYRTDWVWETGVPYGYQPIDVSGVWVDGAFHAASETGAYEHTVDYARGRILFSSPISASSVQCEYSHRLVHVTTADSDWWKGLQTDSFRVDSPDFLQEGSGAWATLADNRVQLPALVVESALREDGYGKQLGDLSQVVHTEVLLHVVSEDRWHLKRLHDVVRAQQEKTLVMFDKNLMFADDGFPLDWQGDRVEGAKMYPDLVAGTGDGGYAYNQLFFKSIKSVGYRFLPPVYVATLRAVCEVDLL